MTRPSPADLADLAAWAEARLPRMIDDACAAIIMSKPCLAGTEDDQVRRNRKIIQVLHSEEPVYRTAAAIHKR